ncbi:MAG: monovalent cation/H(+) antiporter subunit G [Salinisphaera sp.]|jgi:multicomponent Na+:H+ antiporter subunit G|nr:monovalent cation/H(+) antiporter subunit G [Salinisphaera sp.]
MIWFINSLSWALLVVGAMTCVIGGFGMLRMPDFYTRTHAASIADTGGMLLIMFALMLQAGLTLITVKLVLIVLFLMITSPTASHALARAALHDDVKPRLNHDKRMGASGSANDRHDPS